jgi:hypothetical protein
LGLKENGLSPQEKLVRRPEDIKPGHDAFREWVETQHKNVLTKELLAEHYTIPSTKFPPLIPWRTRYDLWRWGGKTSYLQPNHFKKL